MTDKDVDTSVGCCSVVLLFCVFCVWLGLGTTGIDATYSTGFRDGTVQKFAHKGLLLKSWEGELSLSGMVRGKASKGITGVWDFTSDDEHAKMISELQPDEMVRVHYRQVFMRAWFFADTPYKIVKLEKLHGDK